MTKTFVISDTHFGHQNILNFTDDNGELIRPGFDNADQMNQYMIDQWNRTVGPDDIVYHLGDFAMNKKYIRLADQLNGRKKLIRGNHDDANAKQYLKYFENVDGVRVFPKHDIIMSHYPLHPDSLWNYKRGIPKINIHGHTHDRNVLISRLQLKLMMTPDGQTVTAKPGYVSDPRYINVSVEQPRVNYVPVDLEKIIEIAQQRQLDLSNE